MNEMGQSSRNGFGQHGGGLGGAGAGLRREGSGVNARAERGIWSLLWKPGQADSVRIWRLDCGYEFVDYLILNNGQAGPPRHGRTIAGEQKS